MPPTRETGPAVSGRDAIVSSAPEAGEELVARPVRKPGLWIVSIVAVAFLAFVLWSVISSPNVHWGVVGQFIFSPAILEGVWVTIQLTLLAELFGVVFGIVLAIMRLSGSRVLRSLSAFYVWIFRSIPLLVQLILWFNLALIFPKLGVPGTPFVFTTNDVINGFVAALLGLSLHEAAYDGEIIRGGILAVDIGQTEASQALGMSRMLALRRIILPQAIRVIIPSMGNQFISLLKGTAIVAFIAGGDLMTVAQSVYSGNFEVVALLIVASLWYLLLVSVGSVLQGRLEVRFGRGVRGPIRRAARDRNRAASTNGTPVGGTS